MQNIGEQLGRSGLENFRPHPSIVTADAIGVELELEGFTSSTTSRAMEELHPLWTITTDGSLRNGGVELITNGGLGGERLHEAFTSVAGFLERNNYDASWRCSTHMHINMLDFTVPQIARFLLVYAACEPVLFTHCGPARYSSNFCVPVGDSLPFHKTLISKLHPDCVRLRTAARNTVKYTALNLQPLFGDGRNPPLGTIEFRGGRAMTTVDEFVLQANLLLSIKQFVRDTMDDKIGKMLTRLNEGVMNTVYANGCAASLNVPIPALDDALIHAWVLLKAYDNGMKVSQKLSTAESVIPTALRRPTIEPIGNRDNGGLGWWNPGLSQDGVHDVSDFMHIGSRREFARARARGFRSGNMIDQMLALVQMLKRDLTLTDSSTQSIGALWYMRSCDIGPEYPDIGSVYCETLRGIDSGAMYFCIDPSRPPEEQPRFTWGSARFDYMSISEDDKRAIRALTQGENTRVGLFSLLVQTKVRTKRTSTLISSLNTAGFADVTFPTNSMVQVPLLMYWLKVTGQNSVDFVHANYLPLYDRISAVVDILLRNGLSVPFYKYYTNGGRGLIRCETTLETPMGHGISRAQWLSIPAQRRVRTSETTGRQVY